MKNDLIFVGLVLVSICFGLSSYQHDLELKRLHKLLEMEKESKIEVMKVALENDRLNKEYIYILQELREALNDEIDSLTDELKQYKVLEKLKKDLARHSN